MSADRYITFAGSIVAEVIGKIAGSTTGRLTRMRPLRSGGVSFLALTSPIGRVVNG